MVKRYRRAFMLLIILAPLGILAKGTAWGEWSGDELGAKLGYVPHGIVQAEGWWRALFSGYSVGPLGGGVAGESAGYIVSALIGSAMIYGITRLVIRLLAGAKHGA